MESSCRQNRQQGLPIGHKLFAIITQCEQVTGGEYLRLSWLDYTRSGDERFACRRSQAVHHVIRSQQMWPRHSRRGMSRSLTPAAPRLPSPY